VLATALIFTAIGYTAELNRAVGTLFVLGLVSYLVFAYRQERSNGRSQEHTAALEKAEGYEELHGIETPAQLKQETAAQRMGLILAFLGMAIGGLVVIVAGGGLLVEGAIALAREMGISETVIGLSIVAIGTSLPELVTCVVAALRGHSDIALGNIMGSNIYNILGIGGVTALISPTVIPPEIVSFDNFAMLAASFALLVVTKTGYKVTRLEGAALVAAYGAYLWIIWPK
jgi:cation:H+ antiporter